MLIFLNFDSALKKKKKNVNVLRFNKYPSYEDSYLKKWIAKKKRLISTQKIQKVNFYFILKHLLTIYIHWIYLNWLKSEEFPDYFSFKSIPACSSLKKEKKKEKVSWFFTNL